MTVTMNRLLHPLAGVVCMTLATGVYGQASRGQTQGGVETQPGPAAQQGQRPQGQQSPQGQSPQGQQDPQGQSPQGQQDPQGQQGPQEQRGPQGQQAQQPAQPPEQASGDAPPAEPSAQAAANGCDTVPDHQTIAMHLSDILSPGSPEANGGLGNHVWAVVVDRYGTVCAVVRSGESAGDQWPGSRLIAASKANSAAAFSLDQFALSTANLYWPSQPDGSLYGIETSNPMSTLGLYSGEAESWGTPDDPLVGRRVGGATVFAGGLALYAPEGGILGAIGVSGDESCTDHVIAWKLRHAVNLDAVPDGPSPQKNDNIINDLTVDPATGRQKSRSGYGHPACSGGAQQIAEGFARQMPASPEP